MSSVLINTVSYDSYATVAAADTYLAARLGAEAWASLAADPVKGQALVSSTRWLQRYLTARMDTPPLPTDASIPSLVVDACIEMAWVVYLDNSAQDSTDQGTENKRVKAGPVEVEFFRPTAGRATTLPKAAQDLVNAYLASVGELAGISPPFVSGSDPENTTSCFKDRDAYGFDEGLK